MSELQQLMDAISNSTTGLFQLSMVIRRATPRDRYAKAQSVGTFIPDFDIDYVRNKFPRANEWLVDRLGKANARRREYFKYCESHHQSLSSDVRESRRSETATRSEGYVTGLVPSTTASTFMEQMASNAHANFFSEDVSVKSYARSILVREGGGVAEPSLTVPPRPKEGLDGLPFECPYCYTILEMESKEVWM